VRGYEIVAWAQCRRANGAISNLVGYTKDKVGETLLEAGAKAVLWSYSLKELFGSAKSDITSSMLLLSGSGDQNGEYIPLPNLEGYLTQSMQWQKIITLTGFANVYGISISAAPDWIIPPSQPYSSEVLQGSVAILTATQNPGTGLVNLTDIKKPRFDFPKVVSQGWSDKPVPPMAVPWDINPDTYCTPPQLEAANYNINIPIAKHRVPSSGLAVWAYWATASNPRLRVTLVTAPER